MSESNPQKIHHETASGENSAPDQLRAVLSATAVSPLTTSAWIRVTGPDRVRWLNGMVTNSIQQLVSGAGCYNFFLSPQGRIQGDAYAFAEPDEILIRTDRSQTERLTALLDRYIIMDDVELGPGQTGWTGLEVIGPEADALLDRIGIDAEVPLPGIAHRTWRSHAITLLRVHAPLVPRFELWTDAATVNDATEALRAGGAMLVDEGTIEQLRLLEGTPEFGIDISDRDLPQETAQTHALHFAKGCYVGQEIVERIRSRGAVNRILTGLRLDGRLPSADQALYHEDKRVGDLTSCSHIPLPSELGGDLLLALAYVRREVLDRGVALTYDGGTAVPIALPFSPARAQASKHLREEHHA